MPTSITLTVRYAETDQMGIVHHAVYPIWYEAARTEYIRDCAGLSYSELESRGIMMPVLDIYSRYKLPARYEDKVVITVRIKALAISNMEFEYDVRIDGNNAIINSGTSRHAFVDSVTFRPINLRKRYPEFYNMLTDELKMLDGKAK